MKAYFQMVSFTGFYCGMWEYDKFTDYVLEGIEYEYGSLEHRCDWNFVDLNAWNNKFAMAYSDSFFRLVEEHLGLKFKVLDVDVWSPHAYNYATDEIYCQIEVEDDEWLTKLVDLMLQNKEALAKIIDERYTPCPGYLPFQSNKFDEWVRVLQGTTDGDVEDYASRALMHLITAKTGMGREAINNAIYYDLSEDSDIWSPELAPGTDEAREEWERLQAEKEHRIYLSNQPCLPGLEEYR